MWLFSVTEILALWQNWTRKQEVGHCDLILRPFFFIVIIFKSKVPLNKISAILEKKVDFIGVATFSIGSTLDS